MNPSHYRDATIPTTKLLKHKRLCFEFSKRVCEFFSFSLNKIYSKKKKKKQSLGITISYILRWKNLIDEKMETKFQWRWNELETPIPSLMFQVYSLWNDLISVKHWTQHRYNTYPKWVTCRFCIPSSAQMH